jgi:transcriptional regulator of acetoin/glycerol metabolism
VLRRAESICFVEGAQWDERHAGTNAPGTALCLDAPVTIKSAEHFVRPVQRWSCAAAPVHEPGSGAILGVIDVTGGRGVDSPQTLAMVRAAARMAESELARRSLAAGDRQGFEIGLDPVGDLVQELLQADKLLLDHRTRRRRHQEDPGGPPRGPRGETPRSAAWPHRWTLDRSP